jgi:transposase
MLRAPSRGEGAGGTSRPRKVLTTVQIWRPAGFFAVRNTNGRKGSTPVCNPVLGPDPTNMWEVGMDSKRVMGIDVGKRWLDVAHAGGERITRLANDASAVEALVSSLDPANDLVIFERTGGYERALEAACARAGVAWAVVHSHRVQAFRVTRGIKAKTDALDARLLRDFGRDQLNAGKLRLGRPADVTLDALMARRRQLQAALHAEQCRRETAAIELVRASIEQMIEHIEAALRAIEAQLAAHEAGDEQLRLKEQALCERIGVAQVTARGLLAELPELGRLDGKEITALGGLAPRVHHSGTVHKRRGLAPGRTGVKVVLFNPARTAMRFDPAIVSFCGRLRARGKPGKVILVAVMRKLLVQLNAAVRDALAGGVVAGGRPAAGSLFDHAKPGAVSRAGRQGRRSRRAAVPLTAEHEAAS